jgi:uncharacterized protein (DUF2252 family)
VLRLTTSLLLSGRELGQSGPEVMRLCRLLIDSHAVAAFTDAPLPTMPRSVAELVQKVDGRSRKKLLDDRTEAGGAGRHFVRGERYTEAPADAVRAVPAALALFAERTADKGGPTLEQLEILDVAFRIAGTGSLGSLRLAVLTRGKGGDEGSWLFDLKEQATCSVDVLAPRAPGTSRAAEVEQAFRACVEYPPRMMGASKLGEHDVLVRRLTPQEDKLSLSKLAPEQLAPLASYLGALLGAAHRRGRAGEFQPWTAHDQGGILERAIALAGIHEAVYLELCWLTRDTPTTTKP